MKELSIEDKAKRYDEAIERAKEKYAMFKGMRQGDVLEDVFPELKESEKIRKDIINFIRTTPKAKQKHHSWIAWLEKQGEKGINGNEREIPFSEQKPAIEMKSAEESLGIGSGTYNKIVDECIYGEKKPAWSEDDETVLINLIYALANDRIGNDRDEYISWLKDLKDRVQLQNGYNPYKEVVESIAEMCKHYDKANYSGLRDFYDNVKVKCKDAKEYESLFPQHTWKPSEEQMEALEHAINCYSGISPTNAEEVYTLEIMKEQLKKLSE